jgi:hypothetical protein
VLTTPSPTVTPTGVGTDTNNGSQYAEVGNGYCGTSADEEVQFRIGEWEYGQTKKHAAEKCNVLPECNGYHWNINDHSYVLLTKAFQFSCCESPKGDICYRRVNPWVDPAKPVMVKGSDACKSSTAQVTFSFRLNNVNLDFSLLQVSAAIKLAVAAEAGPTIKENNVVAMHQGNGLVQVEIYPPKTVSAVAVQSTLASSTTLVETMRGSVADVLAGMPQMEEVMPFTITDLTVPLVKALYCGGPARELLNGSSVIVQNESVQ